MRFLIGFGLTILGGVLTAVTEFMPFAVIAFIGVFLFASITDDAILFDYRIAHGEDVLFRRRYYIHFLPFTIISKFLTFGKASLLITWKQEYFKAPVDFESTGELTKLSRKEYIALRNEQRRIYSTQVLSKEFMESTYSEAGIGFKRKKNRLIAASIFAALMLTMLTEPDGIYLVLIYEAVFVPMVLLWIPAYKDAKILQQAYTKAVNGTISKTGE